MLLAAEQLGDLSGIKREDLPKKNIEHGEDGLVGYLRWLGKVEPKSFAHMLAKSVCIIEHGEDGLVGYLRWLGKVEPKSFAHMLAKSVCIWLKYSRDPIWH